jgi:hypothetical protein
VAVRLSTIKLHRRDNLFEFWGTNGTLFSPGGDGRAENRMAIITVMMSLTAISPTSVKPHPKRRKT